MNEESDIPKNKELEYGVTSIGTLLWTLNGEPHREDGPAAVYLDGTKEWMLHGRRHRIGGPALEKSDGSMFWYKNGLLHNEEGPAWIEYQVASGVQKCVIRWAINGLPLDFQEWRYCRIRFSLKAINTCPPNDHKPIMLVLPKSPNTFNPYF